MKFNFLKGEAVKAYQTQIKDICQNLKTETSSGLSTHEAKSRLEKYGLNKIKEEKITPIYVIIIRQFLSPLMYILLLASIASIFVGEVKDAIVIGIAMMINVVIGFIQEFRAEKAAQALKSYEVPRCNVRRDGRIFSIEAAKLVPGDIVILPAGSRIPADVRLFYSADFTVEEAILTGEAHPIKKNTEILKKDLSLGDRKNMAYSGTYAIGGKAEGIVTKTGKNTELGRIAQLIIETKQEDTPLQIQIKKFGWFLGWLMLAITCVVFILGLIKGFPFKEIVTISIALAVAAIPEGLLVAVTVVLAIGMQIMLKRKALVRHLVAAETLGSVSVICTDKTGTLTKGYMAVEKTFLNKNFNEKDFFVAATLNNDAQILQDNGEISQARIGNPTEVALLEAAQKNGLSIKQTQQKFPRINEIPFSSNLKYMATVHEVDGIKRLIVKGAPEKIFPMCKEVSQDILDKSEEMAKNGLRVLAIASKNKNEIDLKSDLNDLDIIGITGLHDPLRPHAADTIKELTGAGIRTVVVTGDHKETAINIARGAGIKVNHNVVTGTELNEMSDQKLYEKITSIDLFARVDPKHKIRIVDAWQKHGHSVAMIGDGVNDAPALKSSDIGVALGSGSDVAHEISDMVLLNNNLSSISAAVRQGRIIFDNIRKIIVYLMADSFSEIVLILGSLIMGFPLPILATQIFWINLVTDGFPDLALTMEPGEPEVMTEKPRKKNEPIMNKQMKTLIFIVGIITDIGLFGLYICMLKIGYNIQYIRTIIFTALAIDSLLYVFSVRSMRTSIFRVHPFKNKWLNVAVLAGAAVQLLAIYFPPMRKLFSTLPLGLYDWGIILSLALIKIICIELTKEWFIVRQTD